MSEFRVMTLNINGLYGDDNNSWQQRAPLNMATIQKYAPDLIGLQEAVAANLDSYRQQLSGYKLLAGNCYGDVPPQEYSSILWQAARFELVQSGEFWFSRTPDVASADWGVPYPMGVTWVILREMATGKQLLHLNTHFEDGADGETSRVEASKLITGRLDQIMPDLPTVLTGDFNCDAESWAYRHFLEHGFVDSYLALGHEEVTTFHGFEGEGYDGRRWGGDKPHWRVDWILVRRALTLVDAAIIRDAQPPLYPSDHYPVMTTLKLDQGSGDAAHFG